MHHVSIDDLDFATAPVTCYTESGAADIRWVSFGMPKIDQALIKSTFFLFQSTAAEKKGSPPLATGFIVYFSSERHPSGLPYYYAVSCEHAVRKAPCIRLNKRNGKAELIMKTSKERHSDLDKYGDIAACLVTPDPRVHDVAAIPYEMLLTQEGVVNHEIGVGEDVFMVGLLLDTKHKISLSRNNPLARFGNISMMPSQNARLTTEQVQIPREYALLDIHSRRGYSGSPVFLFRSNSGDLTKPTGNLLWLGGNEQLVKLLGLHCAQYSEDWEAKGVKKDGKTEMSEAAPPLQNVVIERSGEGKFNITGLSGVTLAAPAWDICGLLSSDKLARERKILDARPRIGSGAVLETPLWKTGEGRTLPENDTLTPTADS